MVREMKSIPRSELWREILYSPSEKGATHKFVVDTQLPTGKSQEALSWARFTQLEPSSHQAADMECAGASEF